MASKRTIQVAVEAIANEPDGYDLSTMLHVQADGEQAGVGALYMDMLAQRIAEKRGQL